MVRRVAGAVPAVKQGQHLSGKGLKDDVIRCLVQGIDNRNLKEN